MVQEEDKSLSPAEIKSPDREEYQSVNRRFQGIPSVTVTPGGVIYVVFYSGSDREGPGNFCVLVRSTDGGKHWEDPFRVIAHNCWNVRCFDPNVWVSPDGELFLFWTQSYTDLSGQKGKPFTTDGRNGVWMARCSRPDSGDAPVFEAPRRISDGIMMNKPCVLADGSWAFPIAVWANQVDPFARNAPPSLQHRIGSNLLVSADKGNTFLFRGGVQIPERCFDETMVMELRNGDLRIFVRTNYGIGTSDSSDGGRTWKTPCHSEIRAPNSRFHVTRLRSGRWLLIHNEDDSQLDYKKYYWRKRHKLTLRLSEDEGKSWNSSLLLEAGECTYPDAWQDDRGMIHVVYDSARHKGGFIHYRVLSEQQILSGGSSAEIPDQIVSSYPYVDKGKIT